MPIASDFIIDYANRLIYHNSGSTIYNLQAFYSWLMDVFDDSTTVDDTPTHTRVFS